MGRILEVVRDIKDAKDYAKQIHDMNHGDISLLTNDDRALLLLYKEVLRLEKVPKKRGRPKKNSA